MLENKSVFLGKRVLVYGKLFNGEWHRVAGVLTRKENKYLIVDRLPLVDFEWIRLEPERFVRKWKNALLV